MEKKVSLMEFLLQTQESLVVLFVLNFTFYSFFQVTRVFEAVSFDF